MTAHESLNPTLAKICYVDTSLRRDLGHFANSCRHIVGELRRRRLTVDVYGHRSIQPSLAKELNATAFFRHASEQAILAHAPVSVLHQTDFTLARLSFLQDLKRLWCNGPYDLIYINSIFPAQLAAVAQWTRNLPSDDIPIIVAEFGTPSGAGMADRALYGSPRWSRSTHFYSTAARFLRDQTKRLLLFTFDSASSADYAALLEMRVETMPTIHAGSEEPRLRHRREGALTVSFIGHQRHEKGYHLLPDVVRQLKASSVPVRVLVHNGDPEDDSISRELSGLAEVVPELAFEHRPAGEAYWRDLLDRSDLIALPYERERYRAAYSAVAIEAVSGGIPMVVPEGTTMEVLARTFKTGATTFDQWNAASVTDAIERAVTNFEGLAVRSFNGAQRWREANGAKHFVDRLLELQPLEHKERSHGHISLGDKFVNFVLDVLFAVTMTAMTCARAVLLAFRRLAD